MNYENILNADEETIENIIKFGGKKNISDEHWELPVYFQEKMEYQHNFMKDTINFEEALKRQKYNRHVGVTIPFSKKKKSALTMKLGKEYVDRMFHGIDGINKEMNEEEIDHYVTYGVPNFKDVAFSGWRKFNDYDLLDKVIKNHVEKFEMFDTIHVGDATGLDALVERWFKNNESKYKDLKFIKYYAEWTKLGHKAGPIRNALMIAEADFLIAFPNKEKGIGTQNTIKLAEKKEIPRRVIWI